MTDEPLIAALMAADDTLSRGGAEQVIRIVREILGREVVAKDAEINRLRAALKEIAAQKRTDELETECDVEYADFEEGYDACINRARAAIAKLEGGGV